MVPGCYGLGRGKEKVEGSKGMGTEARFLNTDNSAMRWHFNYNLEVNQDFMHRG